MPSSIVCFIPFVLHVLLGALVAGDLRAQVLRGEVRIEGIRVFNEADGNGESEPYLWPIFFKVDAETLAILTSGGESGTGWFVAPNGDHGNLPGMSAGMTYPIPPAVGSHSFTLALQSGSIRIPEDRTYIGCVVALLEEDKEPSHELIRRGYGEFVKQVVGRLRAVIGSMASNPVPLAAAALEQEIMDRLRGQFDVDVPANLDDPIGVGVFFADVADLHKANPIVQVRRFTPSLGSRDGSYEMGCSLRLVGQGVAAADRAYRPSKDQTYVSNASQEDVFHYLRRSSASLLIPAVEALLQNDMGVAVFFKDRCFQGEFHLAIADPRPGAKLENPKLWNNDADSFLLFVPEARRGRLALQVWADWYFEDDTATFLGPAYEAGIDDLESDCPGVIESYRFLIR
ncbi:MAG: hypothetical protein H6834_10285 [Planctomycetes bacterium]|nr:hypothetical protein [Planctomycetota bacterium]